MPSFAEALYSLSTDKLRKLIRNRGIDPRKMALIPDKRSLVQHISGELNRHVSVGNAIRQCSARELRLLQLAASVENSRGFTWSSLVQMAGGPATEIESALGPVVNRLEVLGLLFRVGSGVLVPEMVRQQTPASLSDRYTLSRLLSLYDAPAIRRIVDKLGLEQEYTTKNSNIEAIGTHLMSALPAHRLSTPLNEAEIGVLEFVVNMGGSATPIEVANVVLDGHTDDFFRYEWQNRWKQGKERNAVDSLLARGILHVTTSGYGYNFFLVIPGDLMLALTGAQSAGFWTDPAPQPTAMPDPPVQSRRHQALLRDVVCMLSFFAVQSAARTNTGHIHKSSLKAIARMLSISDEHYATFLYAICREAGLAAPEGERQLYALTAHGNDWLHWDSSAQVNALFEAWRDGVAWAEMYTEPLMRINEFRHKDVALPARNSVLKVIAESANLDTYLSLDSVASALTFRFPMLLADCAVVTPGSVATLSGFVRQLITECLYWLGLVELGADKAVSSRAAEGLRLETAPRVANSDVAGFRLTPQGMDQLRPMSDAPSALEPREDKFLVQANAEIFVPPYLEPWILYRLLMLTEIPAKGAAGATIHLTRESIRRALDLGETPKEMLAFLQEYSRTGVPQNVEYLINEVGGKHGHIRVGRAEMYLHVDSPLLMKELQSRRELKGYFVRELTDTVAILSGSDIEKVLKDLRKTGYLPVSDEIQAARSFGTAAIPSSGRTAPKSKASVKSGSQPRDAYDSVDWERIARDDGQPWHQQATAAPGTLNKPQGAYDNPSLIRVMLHNACITHNVVEMVWREIGQEPIHHFFEPVSIAGNVVRGYIQHSDDLLNLEVEAIRWAKLSAEKF